jgi:hypothetical protein
VEKLNVGDCHPQDERQRMNTPNDISVTFKRFSTVATEFCDAVDSASEVGKVELLSRIYKLLPRLIQEGIALPSLSLSESDTRKEIRKTRMNDAEWGQLYEFLKEKLGDWNLYWQVFDPTTDSEAIRGSLADDIADIYRDVEEGLGYHDPDLAMQTDITFGWRIGYYSHWGKHAMDAERTIHFLLEDTLS